MAAAPTTMDNKQIVRAALTAIFIEKNFDAADTYYAEDYVPHSPVIANGRAGFKAWLHESVTDAMHDEIGFLMGEGDIVFAHSRATGSSPEPSIGMEVWRVQDGQIAEFWGMFQPEAGPVGALNTNPVFPIAHA